MSNRILIVARLDRAAPIIAALNDSLPMTIETASDTWAAQQTVLLKSFDVMVLDLEMCGSFLLLDALQEMQAAQRPFVIALRHSHADRAVLDPEVVTMILSCTVERELVAMVVSKLASCRQTMRQTPGSESNQPIFDRRTV